MNVFKTLYDNDITDQRLYHYDDDTIQFKADAFLND